MNIKTQFHLTLTFAGLFASSLSGQDCTENSILNVQEDADELIYSDIHDFDEIARVERQIEAIVANCFSERSAQNDTLRYNLMYRLYRISEVRSDISNMVNILTRLQTRGRIIEGFKPESLIKTINRQYKTLRIRYVGEDMTSMAVIKKIEKFDTSNVTVDILPPADAWVDEVSRKRRANIERIQAIEESSREGNLPLYFDSYDDEVGYFYFEIPYVPLLRESDNSANWYAITFDGKKRYRNNFTYGMSDEQRLIQLQALAGWILIKQIPEKYVMLTFDRQTRVVFREKETDRTLKSDEYIRINRGDKTEYYIPSNQEIDVEISNPSARMFKYVEKMGNMAMALVFTYVVYNIGNGI